jgi:O-antigen ligase
MTPNSQRIFIPHAGPDYPKSKDGWVEQFLAIALWGMIFPGFALAVLATAPYGVDSRQLTIPFRAIILGLTGYVFVHALMKRMPKYSGGWLAVVGLFATTYLLALWINPRVELAGRDRDEIILQFLGTGILPMLGGLVTFGPRAVKKATVVLLCIAMAANAIILTLYQGLFGTGFMRVRVAEVYGDVIATSPLFLSYTASLTACLGIFVIVCNPGKFRLALRYTLGFSALGMSMGSMLLGASRGSMAVVFGVVMLLMFASATSWKVAIQRMIPLVVTVSVYVGLLIVLGERLDSGLHNRMVQLYDGVQAGQFDDRSAQGRVYLWEAGWNAFMSSPLYGGTISLDGNYPHNSIIEAFMAAGLLGGIPFVIVSFFALYRSYQLIKANDYRSVFSILYLHYFLQTLVSYSISNNPTFWFSLALVLSTLAWPKVRARGQQRLTPATNPTAAMPGAPVLPGPQPNPTMRVALP